jgi:cell division transport system permease protein
VTVIGYAFEEALVSLRRSGRSALVSIGTIAIAFATLGGFLLISVNVQGVLDSWLAAAEMSIYLHETASEDDRRALEQFVTANAAVAAIEYVPKEQALERFRADFPELLEVTKGVGQVASARLAAALVAGILMLGAAFTVAAVVRLSLHARRDELEIMELVGAPFSYIRGPAIVEGLLLGGAGAAVALAGVAVLHSMLSRWLGSDLAGLVGTGQLQFLGLLEITILLVGGLGVGAAAATLVSRSIR